MDLRRINTGKDHTGLSEEELKDFWKVQRQFNIRFNLATAKGVRSALAVPTWAVT